MTADDPVSEGRGHLTDAELHELMREKLGSGGDRGAHSQHVDLCDICQLRLAVMRGGSWSSGGPVTGACPPANVWYALVEGTADSKQAEQYLLHAGECAECYQNMRHAMDALLTPWTEEENAVLEKLTEEKPGWEQQLAHRIAVEQATHANPKRRSLRELLSSTGGSARLLWVSAILVVAVPLSVILIRTASLYDSNARRNTAPVNSNAQQSPVQPSAVDLRALVAQAYQEQRTVAMRFDGVSHAQMYSVERSENPGNSFAVTQSPALLDAESDIQKNKANLQGDPDFLQAEGRVQILQRQFNAAAQTLREALRIQPDRVSLMNDLSVALLALAETQSGQQQMESCNQALQYISKAYELAARDPVVLFNRALALEHCGTRYAAIKAWQEYLNVDPSGPWAEEARQHEDDLRKQLGRVEHYQDELRNASKGASTADIDSESLLKWAAPAWLAEASGASQQHLSELAQRLRDEHKDPWLDELLRGGSPQSRQLLGQAIVDNLNDTPEDALPLANRAALLFAAEGNRAGLDRAVYEQVYANHRLQDAQHCFRSAAQLEQQPEMQSYKWLFAQLHLEASICANMLVDFPRAARELRQAERAEHGAQYTNLELRILGMKAGLDDHRGDVSAAWNENRSGIEQYRAGLYDAERGFQFYSELGYMGQDYSEAYVGYVYAWESAKLAHLLGKPTIEGMAWSQAGTMAESLGLSSASDDFQQADESFSRLRKDSESARMSRTDAQLHLAALKLDSGEWQQARELLESSSIAGTTNTDTLVRFYLAKGDLQEAAQSNAEARKYYEQALQVLLAAYSGAAAGRDRVLLSRLEGGVARRLIENSMRTGDQNQAFDELLQHRHRMIGGDTPEQVSTLQDDLLNGDADRAVLFYAYLKSGLAVFFLSNGGVHESFLPMPRRELIAAFARFLDRCSTPNSQLPDINSDSRLIGSWLLSPFVGDLARHRKLVVIPDEDLPLIPVTALTVGDTLVNDRWQVLVGLADGRHAPPPSFTAQTSALIVSSAGGRADAQLDLPPLPHAQQEARAVAAHFTHPNLLSDRTANTAASLDALHHAALFHFAGHAIADSASAGLVLPGPEGDASRLSLLRASDLRRQNLPQLQLVVLSACATARSDYAGYLDPAGLVRAFLDVSPATVVASSWNVDSAATGDLMQRFYDALLGTDDAARAMQEAEQQLRATRNWAHPYYWSGFAVYLKS